MTQFVAIDADISKLKKNIILFTEKDFKLLPTTKKFEKGNEGFISKALKNTRFTGAAGESALLHTHHQSIAEAVLIVGLGDVKKMTVNDWRKAGVAVGNALDKDGLKEAGVLIEPTNKVTDVDAAIAFIEGVEMALYRFDQFKTDIKKHQKAVFSKLTVGVKNSKELKKQIPLVQGTMEGSKLARDLVNLPPNVATPEYMSKQAKELSTLGVKVKVLGEKELEKTGLNMLLAVGRGAIEESQLIIMKYTGDKKSKSYKCLVGKGVMFDSGGYNIKGGAWMKDMKADMGGAAAVMGAMKSLAMRKSKVNVIGVCGCVVNRIDNKAMLPSDILTAYNGKTVEVMNTDAEGRLVLGDAISYIIDKENPAEIIDIATLTGACLAALGGNYAGLFTLNDKMSEKLTKAGNVAGERVWRLPLDASYAAKPKNADLNNDGTPYGGASAAAVFLKNFVGDTPWAHIDIAGVGMTMKIPGMPNIKGAQGFGSRLFVEYLES